MARKRTGFYNTIEYIGPRPQKPKRPNIFGGWVILAIAGGIAFWFGKPLVQSLQAAREGTSAEDRNLLIASLESSTEPGDQLAAIAISHSREEVTYDTSYYEIQFPGGDIPRARGRAEDVIIRCYRDLGIDLQKEVNADITSNFGIYPKNWQATQPDPNIDHRRAENLHFFFGRKGQTLANTRNPSDYKPGDIVVWSLSGGRTDIGIVVPNPTGKSSEPWIVHNNGAGVRWESGLFDQVIVGHFRYLPESRQAALRDTAEKKADNF
jgi:uncharacterized protein YijF (DUF1287 family)